MEDQVIKAFLQKVKKANNTGSKEIRLTMSEATELTVALAHVLVETTEKQKEIDKLRNLFSNSVTINGGKF